jgi:hypothetical protein
MENKKIYNLRYTLRPEDIMTFVSGLHEVQHDMIEAAVAKKEREGFPDANLVIKHVMGLK